jgi:hypothetical protein
MRDPSCDATVSQDGRIKKSEFPTSLFKYRNDPQYMSERKLQLFHVEGLHRIDTGRSAFHPARSDCASRHARSSFVGNLPNAGWRKTLDEEYAHAVGAAAACVSIPFKADGNMG